MQKLKSIENGRVVLPAKLRKAAGIKEGKAIAIAYLGKIVIQQPRVDEKEIEEWYNKMKQIVLEVKKVGKEVKWMEEEYVWRKLGLRSISGCKNYSRSSFQTLSKKTH
ncbi:MAG: hypothetical protein DRN04_10965 [Thermoprotei archaeon]|nr:MAG: hypothetical protein DRN04_10965 [Thermoprotei archaeon]